MSQSASLPFDSENMKMNFCQNLTFNKHPTFHGVGHESAWIATISGVVSMSGSEIPLSIS